MIYFIIPVLIIFGLVSMLYGGAKEDKVAFYIGGYILVIIGCALFFGTVGANVFRDIR